MPAEVEFRQTDRAVVAIFDLDGTLTRRDTLFPFLRFAVGPRRFLLLLPRALPALAATALGLTSRERAKEAVLRIFLGGMEAEELARQGQSFARERLPALVRPAGLERLAWHRRQGHLCALASASPAVYVEPWAREAGFDDVFATLLHSDDSGRITGRIAGGNCKGQEKVRRLEARYGSLDGYTLHGYGDSRADRSFLDRCAEAHFRPFRKSAPERIGNAPPSAVGGARNRLTDLLRLMRPHQWLKNAFVLVGVVFAHAWAVPELLAAALLAAAAFSLVSSCMYIINDWVDRDRDRLHPGKRNRPLASGRVTTGVALGWAAALGASGIALALTASTLVLAVIALYAAMNVAYSFVLKNVVILDVFVIAAGFILRILAGTIAIGIVPSQWLLVCSLLLTLFLGFAKRRSELLSLSGDYLTHRQALMQYNAALLDKLIGICASGAIISYSLYTMSPDTARMHGTNNLIYTIPFVVYGIFRYLYLLHAKQGGADTARDLARDPHLLAAVAGWLITTVWLIS